MSLDDAKKEAVRRWGLQARAEELNDCEREYYVSSRYRDHFGRSCASWEAAFADADMRDRNNIESPPVNHLGLGDGTMETAKIVMYESDEAASRKTVTGWVSREGQFWGENEHMARYCGSTHQLCECGNVFARGRTKCSSCEAQQRTDTYYALPMVEWDGETPIVLHDSEQYFFDEDAFLDHLANLRHNEPDAAHEVQPVLCEPMHLHLLSAEDWCDDLPENGDGELPSAVAAKLEELNEAIRKATPVAWTEGKVRINMASLWARLAVPAG